MSWKRSLYIVFASPQPCFAKLLFNINQMCLSNLTFCHSKTRNIAHTTLLFCKLSLITHENQLHCKMKLRTQLLSYAKIHHENAS